jgi:carbamoyltransferase
MYILGLSTMTESAAVLMHGGRVVAAAEEERFSRIKHDGGFPFQAIRWILESQGITLADIDQVAVYWNPYNVAGRGRHIMQTLLCSPKLFSEKLLRATKVWRGTAGEDSGWMSIFRTRHKLEQRFGDRPKSIRFFDHHTCHMASCFYASNFHESAILVMDGAGEAACTTWGTGDGTALRKLDEHLLPHSLGHFYSAVTGYIGFKMLDGEYKLMGLSPYGDPSGAVWMRKNLLRTVGRGKYTLDPLVLDYHRALRGHFTGEFVNYFGSPRQPDETAEFNDQYRDVAASAQRAFEEVVLDMAAELRQRTGFSRLAIAGGCGLNCTVNGKILGAGIFEEIYVPPVPHDAGGALGAAMLLYTEITGKRPEPITHAQFGPEFSDEQIAGILSRMTDVFAERLSEHNLIARAAESLARGEVIGWVQGPMEYGPRALGNRSFLADPRSDSIRDVINEKIKKREPFRPFAPSVKAEKASEYFDIRQASPFMTIIVPVRPEKRDVIPAVVHVDGTARPQTVERSVNPRYWNLLDRFQGLTGVPVLLNTSFNIQEPIVCTPREALATFVRSGVDALALGDYWVTHRHTGHN